MKIYKVYYGYRGMQSWLDCTIKYIRCKEYPKEDDLLNLLPKDTGLFSLVSYIWKIEEYKPETIKVYDLDSKTEVRLEVMCISYKETIIE